MKRKWCSYCLNQQMVPHDKVACRACGKRHGFMERKPSRVSTAQLRKEAAATSTRVALVGGSVPVLVPGYFKNIGSKPPPDRLAWFNDGKKVQLVHRRPGKNRRLHRDQRELRKHASRPYGRLLLNWILWRRPSATVTAFAKEIGSKRATVISWIKSGQANKPRANFIMDMMIRDGTLPALLNDQTLARWRAYQEATCQKDSETSRSSSGSGGYGREVSNGSGRRRSTRRSRSKKCSRSSTDSSS